MPRPVLRRMISEYTREAGLRELERMVAQLARKVARQVVERSEQSDEQGGAGRPGVAVGPAELAKYLGPPRYIPDEKRDAGRDRPGQRPGLDALRRRGAAGRGADHGRAGASWC